MMQKLIFLNLIILIIFIFYLLSSNNSYKNLQNLNINFNYHNFKRNTITSKMKAKAGWMLTLNQVYFINGILNKIKPKHCLEVGVANGGSSILILNVLKDIKDSFLVSLDLNTYLYNDKSKYTGYRVKEFFPELIKNWRLFTGDQPHKYLEKLNIKYDFVFLDTSHFAPGEFINIIEIMPFLNKNSVIILHDITYHFNYAYKYPFSTITPTNIFLMSALFGDKIVIETNNGIENIGAVFLYKYQENYNLNYFLLLLNIWNYIPSNNHLNDLREFIKKYYKKNLYLKIFDLAVRKNKLLNKIYSKFNKPYINNTY